MNDFLRPVSNLENNPNIHFSSFGQISSRLLDFGQCRSVVKTLDSVNFKGIHVYIEKVRDERNKISLTEKTFKILVTGAILTGAVTYSPLLLLIPLTIMAVKAIFQFSNTFISIDNLLNEWINNSEAKGNKIEAASRIRKAFIQDSDRLFLKVLGLTELPSCIGLLSNLKELDLFSNELVTLPPEIGQLSNLKNLLVQNNKLITLPPEIGQLSNLQHLLVDSNKLITLPPEIGQLSNLQDLLVDRNKLITLPPEIGQLSNLTKLYLHNNELITLPPEIGQLSNLTRLGLSHNKLITMPPEIVRLSNLAHLNLSDNKLVTMPPEIVRLSNLEHLDLSDNKLVTMPPEIVRLSNLEHLDLDYNELVALPLEIGQLSKLRSLVLSRNANLEELPISLSGISSLLWVQIGKTKITPRSCDAILQSCRQLRDMKSPLDFPQRLNTWMGFSNRQYDPEKFKGFKEKQLNTLNDWLRRLEGSRDFQKSQKKLANLVCEMLENLIDKSDFKEQFFIQAEANNECCQDRSAMALNEIYVAWKIHDLKNKNSDDTLDLLIQVSKTLALRRHLIKKINDYEKKTNTIVTENVEIFLYYETLFVKEKIGIFTAIENMAYENIGKRDWIDPQTLIDLVNETYIDDLVKLTLFDKLFSKDEKFKNELDEIAEKYSVKMGLQDPNMKDGDWLKWTNDLTKEKDKEDSEAKKAWFNENYKKIKQDETMA